MCIVLLKPYIVCTFNHQSICNAGTHCYLLLCTAGTRHHLSTCNAGRHGHQLGDAMQARTVTCCYALQAHAIICHFAMQAGMVVCRGTQCRHTLLPVDMHSRHMPSSVTLQCRQAWSSVGGRNAGTHCYLLICTAGTCHHLSLCNDCDASNSFGVLCSFYHLNE